MAASHGRLRLRERPVPVLIPAPGADPPGAEEGPASCWPLEPEALVRLDASLKAGSGESCSAAKSADADMADGGAPAAYFEREPCSATCARRAPHKASKSRVKACTWGVSARS